MTMPSTDALLAEVIWEFIQSEMGQEIKIFEERKKKYDFNWLKNK